MDADVIVVGGGVIGTAIAWRVARAGRTVTLIDPASSDPASSGTSCPRLTRPTMAVEPVSRYVW